MKPDYYISSDTLLNLLSRIEENKKKASDVLDWYHSEGSINIEEEQIEEATDLYEFYSDLEAALKELGQSWLQNGNTRSSEIFMYKQYARGNLNERDLDEQTSKKDRQKL